MQKTTAIVTVEETTIPAKEPIPGTQECFSFSIGSRTAPPLMMFGQLTREEAHRAASAIARSREQSKVYER